MQTVALQSDIRWRLAAHALRLPRTFRFNRLGPDRLKATGVKVILNGKDETPLAHEDLIAAIASNQDKAAFRELFHHFAPRLKAYLAKLGTTEERAEDLVQETLVTVWRKAALFKPEKARASTWIYQIARNKFIDQVRRQKYPEVDVDEHFNELVATEETDSPILQGQIAGRVSRALDELSAAQKEVLQLSFYEEMSHSQIAERLSLPLGTVKSRIRLAFDTLRKALGELE